MPYRCSAMIWAVALCSTAGAQGDLTAVRHVGPDPAAWTTARDSARLAQELVAFGVEAVDDDAEGRVLRWSFEMQPTAPGFNDLFCMRPVDRRFAALRVRLRNAGVGFALAVKLLEADGSEYTARRVTLDANGDWTDVEWPWDEFAVAPWSSDENGRLDRPLRGLALIAFDVSPGRPYELRVKGVELMRETPPIVDLRASGVPERVRAGEEFGVDLSLTPRSPITEDAACAVELVRDGRAVWSHPVRLFRPTNEWRSGELIELPRQTLRVPLYLWGGEYDVRVVLGDCDVRLEGQPTGPVATLEVEQRHARPCRAEVKPHNGVPTLFINGQANSAMSYMTYHPTSKYFGQFGEAGVHVYSFPSTCTRHTWQSFARQAWLAPGDHFDFSQLDEQVLRILEADPAAYVFPRVYVNSPDWWDREHPDDLVMYDDGTGEPELFLEVEGKPCPSWASQAWRDDTGYALRRYIQHVRRSPYADRVLGYHVASGTTEEWMYWGANDGRFCDYSPVARQAFRRWLRERYGSDAALQAAWGRPDVTLDGAEVPSFARRSATEHFTFRDPTAARDVIDLHLFLADITTASIRALARVVKDETDGQSLMGTFYGYVLQLIGEQRQQNAGHLDLMGVLECRDIDFVTSPTSYAFRTLGDGYSHFMSLLDSVKLHGKLWFDENDIRTWLVDAPAGQWGRYDTFEDSLRMQEREFANVIGNGCGMWWFDMGGGWYDDERMLAAIEKMRAIADETVDWDRSPVAEVAMVVDDGSLAAMQTGNAISGPLLLQQVLELGRIGAPIATYALDDIGAMPDMKLYLFVNAFAPTDEQVEAIGRKVRRNGAWAVWVYAPGVIDGGQLRPEAAERLTGFRLGMVDEQASLTVSLTADGRAATGLRDMTYGPAAPFGPVLYADDPSAETWGTLGASGRPGLAARRFDDWVSVYSAAPALPVPLLRGLAAAAGVHLYADAGDAVYANRSVLAVAFGTPGEKVIRLPHRADVTDLMARERVAEGATELRVTVPDVSTRIWRLE